ncbi:hypothetical protein EAI25_07400 [Akkermansia muciniphila]|nr:hypothetical protein [Akkermansia muciniphila]
MILTHAFNFSWNAPPCKRRIRFTRKQAAICRCREKTKGGHLSRVLHFSCGERPSSGQPLLPRRKSGKNMEERLILLFVCGTVHLPGSAPSRFQLTVSAAPLHHGRKNRSSRKRKGMLPYSPG